MKEIQKISNDVLKEIKKTLNDQKVGERIREGFKIAILGPPNSGKSSLLNYLSKYNGVKIKLPIKKEFYPDKKLLLLHKDEVFKG